MSNGEVVVAATREDFVLFANALNEALEAAVGLTPDDISNVQSLIDVGEWLVAFETLCTQIYEWEISLEPD